MQKKTHLYQINCCAETCQHNLHYWKIIWGRLQSDENVQTPFPQHCVHYLRPHCECIQDSQQCPEVSTLTSCLHQLKGQKYVNHTQEKQWVTASVETTTTKTVTELTRRANAQSIPFRQTYRTSQDFPEDEEGIITSSELHSQSNCRRLLKEPGKHGKQPF